MQFLKKYLKFIIGIAVLIMALLIFVLSMKTTDNLETGTLRDWNKVAQERRVAAVRMVAATDTNIDLLVACVDKIAKLPDSGEMALSDAVRLCHTGIQLKENL